MPAAALTATRSRGGRSGGFDGTAFWSRSGIAYSMTPAELEGPLTQGHFRLSAIDWRHVHRWRRSAALLHREKTVEALEKGCVAGERSLVAAGAQVAQVMETGVLTRNAMPTSGAHAQSAEGNFRTSDGGTITCAW